MKKLFQLLFFVFFSINAYSQTYNISIQGDISTLIDTIPKGETFGIYSYIKNNSTAAMGNLTFSWYLSSDAAYSADDYKINERVVFTSSSSADMPIGAGQYANVGTDIAKIPTSYAIGCNYFLIMRITSAYTETNYLDNVSSTKICLREKRVDLSTNLSLSGTVFFKGINTTQVVVNESISNDGELASDANTNYVVKVGTSPDHTVGNVYTKPQIHKPIIGAYSKASVQDTFDISTLANGDYYVFLIIDPSNLVKEPKSNNTAVARFRITELAVTTGAYNMPKLDSVKYLSSCNSVIYDDGGLLGDYSPNGNSTLYIYPSVKGAKVRLTVKSSTLADANDNFTLGYTTPFSGFGQTQSYTSTKLIEDYLSYNYEGIATLQFKSDATKQAAGFAVEVKCSYGFDYRPANIVSTKPVYVNKLDTINFSFDLKNVGSQDIASLKYQYGLTKEASLVQPLFSSAIGTSGSIVSQTNFNTPLVKIANNKIALSNISIKDTGIYYIYVKAGIGKNDTDTTDNVIFFPVKIVKVDTLNNQSVNFKNNTSQYISTCNLTLYDDGGPNANYSNNFNGKVYLYPSEPDKIIKIQVSNLFAGLEKNTSNTAFLDVLSANNTQTETLDYAFQTQNDLTYIARNLPFKATMLKFVSNATTNLAGFQLNVTCAQNRTDYLVESFDMKELNATMGLTKTLSYTVRFNNNGNSATPQFSPWLLYISKTKNINDAVYVSTERSRSFENFSYPTTDTISLKNITKSGKYYFIAFLDPANTYSEADRTNNIKIDSVYIGLDYSNRIPIVGTKTIVSCNDTISDHSDPDMNYENNTAGVLMINPPATGQRVKVSFLTFDTEIGNDQLYVYNGAALGAPLIGRYSGNALPPDIIATNPSGALRFDFSSGNTVTKPGFSFKTSCEPFDNVNIPVSGSQTLKTCGAVIYDNGGATANYAHNADGKITIVPSEAGKSISLKFDQLALYNDFLEIYDGEDVNATLLTSFTLQSYTLPINIKASANNPTGALTLRFKTDASLNMAGFTTWVSCVTSPQKEILFPYAGKRDVVSCGDTIYDNGGSAANGTAPTSGMITLKPRNANEKVRLDFVGTPLFTINSNFQIFDGDSTNAPLLASSKTSVLKSALATNAKGSLTLYYTNGIIGNSSDNFKFATSCLATTTIVSPVLKDTIVYGCNQTIFDNGGNNGAYSNDLNKSITIYPDVNTKKIKLTANEMAIHETDTLYVFDGPNANSNLIGKFNGTQLLPTIISTNENKTGALTLKFVTDNALTAEGFRLFATCVDSVLDYSIPYRGNRVVTTCGRNITDVISDQGDYYNNSDGSLTIKPNNTKNRVQITFNSYDLESGNDFIYVYDGNSVDSKLIGTYTGKNTNTPFLTSTSEDGSLTVRFVSNSSITKPGFKFSISCLSAVYPIPSIGSKTITACEGSVADDGGSLANYTNNSNGTLTVYPEIAGRMIRVFFNTFNLQSMDSLSVYNGESVDAPLIGSYTGTSVTSATANNTTGALTLLFKSDATGTSSGFSSTISCVIVTGEQEFYNDQEEQFQLIPNPAQHFIYVNKAGKNAVYNVAGVLILTTEKQEVDISNLPSGIYRLINTNGNKTRAKSFVKN